MPQLIQPPKVTPFFDKTTFSYTYVVSDPASRKAVIIDPVYHFDPASGTLSDASIQDLLHFVTREQLSVQWILETHIHADHLSAATRLKTLVGARCATSAEVIQVQNTFATRFNAEPDFARDGSQFDRLLLNNDQIALGNLTVHALHTPGHTAACMTYVIGNCAFVGDTLFMPDYGTARTDFPGGNAQQLFKSIERILKLPHDTRLFMCHDYGTTTRTEFACESSVAQQRANNIHLAKHSCPESFARFRKSRDRQLSAPRLLYPAVQFNMRGGQLPPRESNGQHYLKIPVTGGT